MMARAGGGRAEGRARLGSGWKAPRGDACGARRFDAPRGASVSAVSLLALRRSFLFSVSVSAACWSSSAWDLRPGFFFGTPALVRPKLRGEAGGAASVASEGGRWAKAVYPAGAPSVSAAK